MQLDITVRWLIKMADFIICGDKTSPYVTNNSCLISNSYDTSLPRTGENAIRLLHVKRNIPDHMIVAYAHIRIKHVLFIYFIYMCVRVFFSNPYHAHLIPCHLADRFKRLLYFIRTSSFPKLENSGIGD